ncbi:unnamed protein product [Nesidiocoris tenuis]|uniref:Uncharacterized protein n=1 Tax=Nesidiocoris tenuis TaxID=355587 RepID=A0A6H5GIW3_9HEMI|nr:unnamed protein product [Nesidiocoris tenuis]
MVPCVGFEDSPRRVCCPGYRQRSNSTSHRFNGSKVWPISPTVDQASLINFLKLIFGLADPRANILVPTDNITYLRHILTPTFTVSAPYILQTLQVHSVNERRAIDKFEDLLDFSAK